MPNTLTQRYQQALTTGTLSPDLAQAEAIRELESCMQALLRPLTLSERFKLKTPPPVRGLYLWGNVGRGKTQLMDLFFECLPIAQKRREHFHAFMRDIHQALALHQGKTEPLKTVAAMLAKTTRVLCLDEFFVEDIGDAMILGNLLAALFEQDITLIVTSNTPPENLYANGLQRGRFLPAITLLQHHCVVHELLAGPDYRHRPLTLHELWLPCPHEGSADPALRQFWLHQTATAVSEPLFLDINHRRILAVAAKQAIVWFRFSSLCSSPRSQQDYLVIAENYRTVILSDIPIMTATENNAITYFIYLIDILYDAKVRLIVAAAAPPEALYTKGRLETTYQRTLSRLAEMQSLEYQQQVVQRQNALLR